MSLGIGYPKVLVASSRKLAVLSCVAAVSCLVSPVDYPVGDLDGKGGGASAGAGAGTGGGTTEGGTAGSGGTGASAAAAGITAGGTAGSGGSAGGAGTGGSSGLGGGAGSAGSGGTSPAVCGTIPPKLEWIASASFFAVTYPPEQAIDDDVATRFQTGAAQSVGQWLEIDFGQSVSLSQVNLVSSTGYVNDYPRGYEVSVSDTANNTNGTPLASGAGVAAMDNTIALGGVVNGRYLLIELTEPAEPSWWTVSELDVICE